MHRLRAVGLGRSRKSGKLFVIVGFCFPWRTSAGQPSDSGSTEEGNFWRTLRLASGTDVDVWPLVFCLSVVVHSVVAPVNGRAGECAGLPGRSCSNGDGRLPSKSA